jgi:hypothetical protein
MKTLKVQLSEYDEQCLLVEYLELKNLKFSKTAQETFTNHWGVTMKNKKSGLRKGIPDMLIIIPNKDKNRLLFIEMKAKKGTLSQEQKDWNKELNNCEGVECHTCYGFDDAKNLIDLLLKKYA